jgi:hypothetical protein
VRSSVGASGRRGLRPSAATDILRALRTDPHRIRFETKQRAWPSSVPEPGAPERFNTARDDRPAWRRPGPAQQSAPTLAGHVYDVRIGLIRTVVGPASPTAAAADDAVRLPQPLAFRAD